MSVRPWQLIRWEKPTQGRIEDKEAITLKSEEDVSFRVPPLVQPLPLRSLRAAFETLGRPGVPGSTPLEEARILLKAGAEVEHALLVEYLYAGWSLSNAQTASLVASIAVQEMCHLITVQNLLLFTGDLPHLDRQDQDPDPPPHLAPFPFSLRPFSKPVLEEFLLAEMPPQSDFSAVQHQVMDPLIAAHQGAGKINPVGLIYAKVYWLFQVDDTPTARWPEAVSAKSPESVPGQKGHIESFPGQNTATTFQVDPTNEPAWRSPFDRGGIFELIGSRDAALNAIADIAAQGEGLVSTPGAPSHFGTFFDLHQTTDFNQVGPPRPTDPFVADQPSADPAREANRITTPLAAALCKLFDVRYQILLAAVRAALSRDRSNATDAPIRAKYAGWALNEMLSSIRFLSGAILKLPCKTGGTTAQLSAAPTFGLGSSQLPDDPKALDDLLLSLHRSAAALITAALAQNPDAVTRLNLQQLHKQDVIRFPNL
jgi:hypothetical protein